MDKPAGQKWVMIIAGEASGDLHGSNLVRAMREKDGSLSFCGVGGKELKAAGVEILADATTLSVVGITEVFSKLPAILNGLSVVKKALKQFRPGLLVLIDFPDFNLMAAAAAKKLGIPVLYYISPQIWAWRSGRVNKIKRLVDHMAVILPFEADFYKEHGVPVTFVGHPLLDVMKPGAVPGEMEQDEGDCVIGLLPGSRDREVSRHLPVMLDAAREISRTNRNARLLVSRAPSIQREIVDLAVRSCGGMDMALEIVSDVHEIFRRAMIVIAVSGTVTLEAAISGTPMVIIYKVSPVSFWIGKRVINVGNIGLASLIAGEDVAPELVQGDANAENIANTVNSMIKDTEQLRKTRDRLLKIREAMGSPGVAGRTADIALKILAKIKD